MVVEVGYKPNNNQKHYSPKNCLLSKRKFVPTFVGVFFD